MTLNFNSFRAIACALLGAFVGALIALPLLASTEGLRLPLFIAFTAAGGLIGYRKRASTLFFYFSLIAVVALASLISYQEIYRG